MQHVQQNIGIIEKVKNMRFSLKSSTEKCRKTEKVRNPLVLLHFLSTPLLPLASLPTKNWKYIGFIVFSSANVSKTNVLSILRSKNVIKLIKNLLFWSKRCAFTENPCAKMQKTQKSEKTISFYMKNCKKEQFCFKNKRFFFVFLHPGPRDTRIFWDFRFCGMWGCFV